MLTEFPWQGGFKGWFQLHHSQWQPLGHCRTSYYYFVYAYNLRIYVLLCNSNTLRVQFFDPSPFLPLPLSNCFHFEWDSLVKSWFQPDNMAQHSFLHLCTIVTLILSFSKKTYPCFFIPYGTPTYSWIAHSSMYISGQFPKGPWVHQYLLSHYKSMAVH